MFSLELSIRRRWCCSLANKFLTLGVLFSCNDKRGYGKQVSCWLLVWNIHHSTTYLYLSRQQTLVNKIRITVGITWILCPFLTWGESMGLFHLSYTHSFLWIYQKENNVHSQLGEVTPLERVVSEAVRHFLKLLIVMFDLWRLFHSFKLSLYVVTMVHMQMRMSP